MVYNFDSIYSVILTYSIEEYLEKVIEKLPYIGEEYKKEKELERQKAARKAAGEDVSGKQGKH